MGHSALRAQTFLGKAEIDALAARIADNAQDGPEASRHHIRPQHASHSPAQAEKKPGLLSREAESIPVQTHEFVNP